MEGTAFSGDDGFGSRGDGLRAGPAGQPGQKAEAVVDEGRETSDQQTPVQGRQRLYTSVGVLVLTVVIFAPLFRPGRLVLLDWVPGPRPQLSPRLWGFPAGGPLSGAPVETFFYLLQRVAPWGFVTLLPLVITPALAAWGFWRLFRPSSLAVLASTLFLVVNPFTYERMLAGHLYLVVGIALLPLFVSYLIEGPSLRPILKAGLLFAALVALSVHFVFIAGLIVLTLVVVQGLKEGRTRALATAATLGVAGAVSVYWILPSVITDVGSARLGESHLDAFRTVADRRFGLLPNVIGLYGFWRAEWPLPKQHFGTWPVLMAVILLVVSIGFRDLMRRPTYQTMALALALAGVAGIVLALGNQGPTGPAFVWLFKNVPGFAAMRESQKFLALLVFAYAATFGWGVKILAEQTTARRTKVTAVVVLLLLPTVYGFRELWGFAGFARPSKHPSSWIEADRLMGSGDGKVWALPWHQYMTTPWAQGRVLYNPADSFFRREVIVSADPEVLGVKGVDESNVQDYLDFLVSKGPGYKHIGRMIAPLGIKYVLLARVADSEAYSWLRKQNDLRVVRQWRDLVLFENEERVLDGAVVPDRRLEARDWEQVLGLARKRPLVSTSGDSVQLRSDSPARVTVLDRVDHGPLVTSLTPVEGWEYEGSAAYANLGLTAAFDVPDVRRGTIRYVPWEAVRLGYLLGVLVLGSVILTLVWRRNKAQTSRTP